MRSTRLLLLALAAISVGCVGSAAADLQLHDELPLQFPEVGSYQLRILEPSLLELTLITSKKPDPAPLETWNFVNSQGQCHLPAAQDFIVSVDGKTIPVKSVGFKRRVLYAPIKVRDLRIANYLYLQLAAQIPENQTVEVQSPQKKFLPAGSHFVAKSDPLRLSPV